MGRLAFKVAAYEPVRNAHASTNALRLRQIAGGPIAPMRTPRGSWLARTFNSFWRTA